MIPSQVAAAVQHHWWLFLLRGVAALAFGVLTLAWPGATLLVLMAFIAAYALVDGIVALVYAFRLRAMFDRLWMLMASIVQFLLARAQRAMGASSGWSVLGGFLSLALAAAAVVYPRLTVTTVLALIAWFALVVGVVQLVVAFRVRSFARALTTA